MATLRAAVAVALALLPGVAPAAPCGAMTFEGQGYTVCTVSAGEDLRLFLDAPDGSRVGSFDRLRAILRDRGLDLRFAMNAGMYHEDRSPVGLYIEEGVQVSRLVTSAGPGNFGLLPNGVFCVGDRGFAVIESRGFAATGTECRFATQSGPMLVIGGALHPRFIPDSSSRNVRNGVGVSADGATAWFAISDRPVNFHDFARLFRDGLSAPDALYLDGNVSRLFAPALGRRDLGPAMGPIVALVARG